MAFSSIQKSHGIHNTKFIVQIVIFSVIVMFILIIKWLQPFVVLSTVKIKTAAAFHIPIHVWAAFKFIGLRVLGCSEFKQCNI